MLRADRHGSHHDRGGAAAARQAARDTSAAVAHVPDELGSALLAISGAAFTHGMNWAAVLGGIAPAVTALIANVILNTVVSPTSR